MLSCQLIFHFLDQAFNIERFFKHIIGRAGLFQQIVGLLVVAGAHDHGQIAGRIVQFYQLAHFQSPMPGKTDSMITRSG